MYIGYHCFAIIMILVYKCTQTRRLSLVLQKGLMHRQVWFAKYTDKNSVTELAVILYQ